MSFREQKDLQEQPREVRRVKKNLPFTVTEIGNFEKLQEWRVEQSIKQAKWEAEAPQRYEKTRERAVEVALGLREPTPYRDSEQEYNERQAAMVREACRPKEKIEIPKQSLLRRAISNVLNFFLDIKFE